MDTNDGGPAFPTIISPGMSLRDWFAGQAMAAMFAPFDYTTGPCNAAMAERAYAIADAMLAVRDQESKPSVHRGVEDAKAGRFAADPTQPSGKSTIGDKLIAGLEGFRYKLKSGEPIEAVTYTTPPAPKEAGKRGDEAEMRRRGWEWDGQLRGWTKATREHKYIVWYDHSDSTWNANDGIENIDSYSTQLAAVDACETYTPESTQPATLPWHDIGPGLSVAVVGGRCYIATALFSDVVAPGFWNGNGRWTPLASYPTIAAAKSACDAHHAKGGEA